MSDKYQIMSDKYQIDSTSRKGWGVFTGSEGEDPKLSAWFSDRDHAEKWVKDHQDDNSEYFVFNPSITRTAIDAAAWNDYHEPPDMDDLLEARLLTR